MPLLKLHGSISWSVRHGELVKYHDCRPAIRGDAAIVAPILKKTVPRYLRPIWTAAADASPTRGPGSWSDTAFLPTTKQFVPSSERRAHGTRPFTCSTRTPRSASRFRDLTRNVRSHPGLPVGFDELRALLKRPER